MVILEEDGLNQDMGTQIPVRDFLGGIGRSDHLLTMGAVVTVFPETGDFRTGRNQILLNVFKDFLGFAQEMAAVRASFECLFNHPVNRLRLCSGQAFVSGFLTGRLGTPRALGEPQGLQEFLSGFRFFFGFQRPFELFVFLLELEELFHEFFARLSETEDFLNQLFFGFLSEEQLAVCFHNPNNGQERDFFEGLASGG